MRPCTTSSPSLIPSQPRPGAQVPLTETNHTHIHTHKHIHIRTQKYIELSLCVPDYSELPPHSLTNGPRDPPCPNTKFGAGGEVEEEEEEKEEEENGYDIPKPRLPLAPARRTLSELGCSSSSSTSSSSSSSAAFSRLSMDVEPGLTAGEESQDPLDFTLECTTSTRLVEHCF